MRGTQGMTTRQFGKQECDFLGRTTISSVVEQPLVGEKMKRNNMSGRVKGFMMMLCLFFMVGMAPEVLAKTDKHNHKGHEFDRQARSLTVIVKGEGKVTSAPEGIMCTGGVCKARFPHGTVVRLTATPDEGQMLTRWRGACWGSKSGCRIKLKRPGKVLATFKTPRPIPLRVYVKGQGKVVSSPEGLSCENGKCIGKFPRGTVVSLKPVPGEGEHFSHWRGACWGSKSGCRIKLKRPRKVLATFKTPRPIPLRVYVKGQGKVVSSPEGLSCENGKCIGKFPRGTVVSLKPVPGEGEHFSHWRGACGKTEQCRIKLRWPRRVLVAFKSAEPPKKHVLTVSMKGGGTVTSQPEGLKCGEDVCRGEFPHGTVVALTAMAKPESVFYEWGGECKGNESCSVTLNGPMEVTATFVPPPNVALKVTLTGTGSVSSQPQGLTCVGSTCNGAFPQGTLVTLTAVAGPNQIFSEWGGGVCTGNATCNVTLTDPVAVTAAFVPPPPPPDVALTVTLTGTGSITSQPQGLTCVGSACNGAFPQGSPVTLTAVAGPNQIFSEWGGGVCTGNATCTVILNAPVAVTAAFVNAPPPANPLLTVNVSGVGSVFSSPAAIRCPNSFCTAQFPNGTVVILNALPGTGQTFSGWSGGGCGVNTICTLTINGPVTVTATFISSTPVGMTDAEAIRFLEQSTWGPDPASITHLKNIGKDAFLAEQFSAQPSTYPDPDSSSNSLDPLRERFFFNAFQGQDQLRQRVTFALSQLFVVSANTVGNDEQMIPYVRLLHANAFGNFATLMEEVTLSPTMGRFLDMVNNDKTDPTSGLNPNENYAREILQLFTVGTTLLNSDGSNQTDSMGQPIPSYDQDVIINLSRVFTGWTYPTEPGATPRWRNPSYYNGPMEAFDSHHDMTEKVLMNGFTIPAGQTARQDLNDALRHIFQHPNVGPFVATRLIRNLVTSNPSPGYIQRVATVFDADQSGTRGNLQAVIRAILMDPEAAVVMTDGGHLREPILLGIALLRALDATVPLDNPLYSRTRDMGQSLFSPPSVFSYFSPLYKIPGTTMYGPEYQIHTLSSSIARANYVDRVVNNSLGGGVIVDLSPFAAVANDPEQLVALVESTLLHGSLSNEERQHIITALSVTSNVTTRARMALYLVAVSSKYQVQH